MDRCRVTGRELGLGPENKTDISAIQRSHPVGRYHLEPSCRIFFKLEGGTDVPCHCTTAQVKALSGSGFDHHDA